MSFEKEYVDAEDLAKVETRVAQLEAECRSLRAIAAGHDKGHPCELGTTYIAPGDPIPNTSAVDILAGNVYLFKDNKGFQKACQFVKNESFAPLFAGQSYKGGIVDKTLRNSCQPNNFCYLEI